MVRAVLTTLGLAILFSAAASAETFKSAKECTVGARVADSTNHTGTIVRIDGVMCYVKRDDGSSNSYAYIFWMLHPRGQSAETDDKLIPGRYACYADGHYTFMDIRITGPNTYSTSAGTGKFHVEPSRKIVFETGSLKSFFAKLVRGPNIDLNSDGGSFYATTCSYQEK
ncbi:MAG TPA: hypothetical protein VMU71_10020 [Terracidiphilus sp.]|nr:hypothetical protein [Terracidiphilus sp.]